MVNTLTMAMKKRLILIAMMGCLVLTACKPTQSVGKTSTTETSSDSERDGSSFEKAVIAKSIDFEYEWIRKNYPNSRVTQQSLLQKNGKRYDKLTTLLADGTTREFYFNIDSFFGKF